MVNYEHQFFKIRVVFHTLYLWNKDGDPHFFFCISETSNSLSDCGKNLKKIYLLENFLANVLKYKITKDTKTDFQNMQTDNVPHLKTSHKRNKPTLATESWENKNEVS